jgi:two-component system, OmpR family, sensor histidine kinase BaeS
MRGAGPPWARGSGGGRPPWWPAGQQWSPPDGANWRLHGRRLARRVGCFFGLALLIVLSAMVGVVWLVLSVFRVVSSAPLSTALAVTALVLGALVVLIALLVLRRLAAPVGALIEGAHRIEAGDYSARVPVRGPADLRSLARALNDMSGRLEAEETRRRSVVADIAHELRTPLTIIRGQAEAIADGIYPADAEHMAPIVSATESLEMLTTDLSTLTLLEGGSLRLHREPIDVDVLVNETLDAFRPEASAAAVTLTEAMDAYLPPIDADPYRIRGVLGNLVGNALSHAHRGGEITVEGVAVDTSVRLTVRDNGAGIPADLLPRVFDRFVKGPGSTGSGLGLAIVRDVVEAHGGSVAATSRVGEGTAISVTLPTATAGPARSVPLQP